MIRSDGVRSAILRSTDRSLALPHPPASQPAREKRENRWSNSDFERVRLFRLISLAAHPERRRSRSSESPSLRMGCAQSFLGRCRRWRHDRPARFLLAVLFDDWIWRKFGQSFSLMSLLIHGGLAHEQKETDAGSKQHKMRRFSFTPPSIRVVSRSKRFDSSLRRLRNFKIFGESLSRSCFILFNTGKRWLQQKSSSMRRETFYKYWSLQSSPPSSSSHRSLRCPTREKKGLVTDTSSPV